MRVEEDIDVAQLTPIGSFIVAECRRKLYRDARSEEQAGNYVVRVYIDSISTTSSPAVLKTGHSRGEYKTKVYQQVRIVHNRFYGRNEAGKWILKSPGTSGDRERAKVISEMEKLTCQNGAETHPP